MKKYELDTQEKWFYIATNQGWIKIAGQTAIANGFDVSIYIMQKSDNEEVFNIIFSSLKSGAKMFAFEIDWLEALLLGADKDSVMRYMERGLDSLCDYIDQFGVEKLLEHDQEEQKKFFEKFGPIPAVEIISDFDGEVKKAGGNINQEANGRFDGMRRSEEDE